jgi:hypothetical protein
MLDFSVDDNVGFFSSLYHKYDVNCFSETMQNSPHHLSRFDTPFILNAKKKLRGRKSGDICKNNLLILN